MKEHYYKTCLFWASQSLIFAHDSVSLSKLVLNQIYFVWILIFTQFCRYFKQLNGLNVLN